MGIWTLDPVLLGDLTTYQDTVFSPVIKICFIGCEQAVARPLPFNAIYIAGN